jgi:hypothetical protein
VAHTTAVAIPPAGGDLLANSLFANGTSGWSGVNSVLAHADGGDAPIGNGMVALVTRSPGQGASATAGVPAGRYGIISSPVTARAGYEYTATALVRSSAQTGLEPLQMWVRERSPEGAVVATWPSAVYDMSPDSYTRITASYVAQKSGDTIDTYILRGEYPGYSSFQGGSGESFDVDAYMMYASAPAYIPSGNLTSDPSFEAASSGTQGWAAGGGTVARVQDEMAPDGNYVAQLQASSSDNLSLSTTDQIAASAGATYTATAWVRAANSAAAGTRVQLVITDSSGGAATSAPLELTSDAYKELTVSYSAAAPGGLRLTVATVGPAVQGEALDADALTLRGSSCDANWGTFGVGNWPAACWRPYSETSFLNTPIADNAAVVSDSSARVADLLSGAVLGDPQDAYAYGWGQYPSSLVASYQPDPSQPDGNVDPLTDQGSHPTFWSSASDPVYTVSCSERWGPNGSTECPISDATAQQPIHVPAGAIPAGYFQSSSWDHDAHMTVVDQANNIEYDMWGVQSITPGSPGRIVISWGGYAPVTGPSATGVGATANATAGHFALLAGIIRAQELQTGEINHALFMTVPCVASDPAIDGGADPVPPVAPFGHADHICNQGPTIGNPTDAAKMAAAYPDSVPMGAHLRLNMSIGQIENLPQAEYPTWEKAILTALATYGGYVADTSDQIGQWGFQVEGATTYTSFRDSSTGKPYVDPLVNIARSAGVQPQAYDDNYCPSDPSASPFQTGACSGHGQPDEYYLNLDNIDWTRLQILTPGS